MAKVLIGSDLGNYAFNKVAQTITFDGFNASLERVLLVTDVTNNTIIYQFNDATKGGTLAGNVLTLTYNTNTGAFNNSDSLQIFYWSEEPQDTALLDLAISIKRDLQMIRREPNMTPLGMNVNVTGGSLTSAGIVTQLNYFGALSEGAYSRLTNHIWMSSAFQEYKNKIIT
jgi:hypothetical protein